jgi:S1-C subfamily serine protease
MQRSGPGVGVVVVLALLAGAIGGAAVGYVLVPRLAPPVAAPATPQVVCPPSTLQVRNDSNAIVQAVKTAGDAVVKVIAAQAPQQQDPLAYLYGAQPEPQVAIGSGFIINYEGKPLVLTNVHVAGQADQLIVKLVDGRELRGEVAGAEPTSDIAAISLVNPPANLPTVALGDSDKLQVGEWVIAIGNPYDYEHTVTVGVVSATGYRMVGQDRYQNVIQTDAAINSGNSGGPLVNAAGQVIGINYRIFSPTGATVGIGFAIPINSAKQMLYFLTEGGPYVGLGEIVNNSPGLAQYLGLPTTDGVIVIAPARGGPAAQAGIQPRDVILAVGSMKIRGQDQLRDELLKHKIGDTITLTVQRGAQQLQVSMVAGRHPEFKGG